MKFKLSVIAVLLFMMASCEKGVTEDDTILKYFSEAYEDSGFGIAAGNDCYYICGQITDSLESDDPVKKAGLFMAGFDGNLIGSIKTFGDNEGSAAKIAVLNDGSVIATGYVLDNSLQKDLIVIHTDKDLNAIKTKVYQSSGNQYGVDIIQTSEGFLVLATTDVKREPATEVTGNAAGKKDILLMRLNNDLEPLAEIPAVGFIGNDEGVAVKADLSGGYTIVGTTDRSDRPSTEQSANNIIIVKLNAAGYTTQPRIMGGLGNEAASDFEVLSDGYLIAGTKGNAGTDQMGYLWKMPLDIYSAPEFENAIDIQPNSAVKTTYSVKAMCRYKSSSYLLAGHFGAGLSARMLIFSIDATGTPSENSIKITGGTGTQTVSDIISDASGNVITVGSNSYENNSMICLLKFRF